MRFFIETYGCQMNFAESISMKSRLEESGWEESTSFEDADIVIINTCAVRQTAENRVWGRLGFFGRQKKEYPFRIALLGCMAERIRDTIIEKAPFVDYVVGVSERFDFMEFLCGEGGDLDEDFPGKTSEGFLFDTVYGDTSDFKAFVPIMHGCDNFCTYCIVPYVRGREVSRDPEEIFSECRRLYNAGVLELTLLGQNVNSYNAVFKGRNMLFPELLERIIEKTPFHWIRFISSHPKDFSPGLIRVMKDNTNICRHVHLPVQHGSDTILARMNRQYTRMQYIDLLDTIRSEVPDIALSTDLLIGFPGESEKDFLETVDLLELVRYNDAFTYYYNPRKGTRAASFDDQLPLTVKKERLQEIIRIQRTITLETRISRIGMVEDVLIEAVSKKKTDQVLGRTSRNDMVVCPGHAGMAGSTGSVVVRGISGTTLQGDWMS